MSVPRRIVTGHDESGKSVILSDSPSPKAGEPEPTDRPIRVGPPASGVMIRFTDMAPGAESPMHRTETLDVGVVLEGETWLLLDDGSETRVGPGDAVVQRGTNHAWANRSARPVRMLFVLVDGTITDEVRAAAGPLEFFDGVLD